VSHLRPPNPPDFSAEWLGGQRTPAWERLWNRLLTDVPVCPDTEAECAKNNQLPTMAKALMKNE